ncbi:glycosyltransferase [Nocardioides sp. Root151]|uniref:glycosyltransferase n=1 Tax=Nocardioides sp. Root151 TaxID=1736475 RepID=UPI00070261EE|nr:glycosyltransferase [Nocardioides sp. Root151]KQZ67228.1 glycosyl transferase family 1 [Nocardioides sp. Root151]
MRITRPRVAIAHDYLTQRGGAERVVLSLAKGFPDAPIYTSLYEPETTFPEFKGLDIRTSSLNRVRAFRSDHRKALPFLAHAMSQMTIDADVVIASSSGWAHGVGGDHKKLVYCYSPARWLYQSGVYLSGESAVLTRLGLRAVSTPLREWDRRHARAADRYLAISTVVQARIRDAYGLDSTIVPAPSCAPLLDVAAEAIDEPAVDRGGYVLCVSRLLPYKNVDKVVAAFRELPDRHLVVVGRGPEWDNLTRDLPANVTFLRDLTDGQMRTVYERSAALVAASHEDFGLTPLEAAAFGKPSVVLAAGGFLDTMVEDRTAVFFDAPEPARIADGIRRLFARTWSTGEIMAHGERFSESEFLSTIEQHVLDLARPAEHTRTAGRHIRGIA